jgi:hypothetical protein
MAKIGQQYAAISFKKLVVFVVGGKQHLCTGLQSIG